MPSPSSASTTLGAPNPSPFNERPAHTTAAVLESSSALTDVSDFFLPASVVGRSPAHEEARRVALATLGLLGSNAFFLVLTQLRDLPPFQALGLAVGIAYGVGVLALLRLTGLHRLAGTLLIAGFLGVLVFQSVVDLGISNPSLIPSLLVPLIAAFILPRAYVVAFGAGVSALYVGLYLAHVAGWEVPFRATDEDTRVYLVVLYCSTGAALSLGAYAYAHLRSERARLLADVEQERAARLANERDHRERFETAVAAATGAARRDVQLHRDRLREVLYAARLEASYLASGASEAAARDVALRMIRLANSHEAFLALQERVPQPRPLRLSALVKRAVADVAAVVPSSSNVQFWVQREGTGRSEPWPTAAHEDAGDDRLTAPEAPVVADAALLYWSLRLSLEYAAETAPHGHVTVTLRGATDEAGPAAALSVQATDSAAVNVFRDLDPNPCARAHRPGDLVGALGATAGSRQLTIPDTTVRDVRLSLARTLLERGGGRLDVLMPRRDGLASAPPAAIGSASEGDGAGGFAWLSSPDEILLHVELPHARPSDEQEDDAGSSSDELPSLHLQPA